MNFPDAVTSGFKNYVNFSGRSARSDYWFWALFVFVGGLVTSLIDNSGTINALFSLATILPGLAVGARRLHDIEKSGWWLLLCLIPLVGWIVLIIWFCQKGTDGENRFGLDPLVLASVTQP